MPATKAPTRRKSTAPMNAIELLKADHGQVEEWFERFEKSRSGTRKATLAAQICAALTIHATIEEEILDPAFLAFARDKDLHHEAVVEHHAAKKLIAEIELRALTTTMRR